MVSHAPLDGAGKSYNAGGEAVCRKLMGTIANDRFGDLHVHVQPNAWFHMLADHAVVFSVLPLAPGRTAPAHDLAGPPRRRRRRRLRPRDADEGVERHQRPGQRVRRPHPAGRAGPRLRARAVLEGRGRRRRVRHWYVARIERASRRVRRRIDEIGRCGPSVSCAHGIDGGESQAQPVGQEGDHAPPRHRRGPERERLVAGAGGRAAARDGAADDPDARAGGLPAADPRRRPRGAGSGAAAARAEHRRAVAPPRGVPPDHGRSGRRHPGDRDAQRRRARRRAGRRRPGRRAGPAAPAVVGRSALPAARQRQRQGAPGHLRRGAPRALPPRAARPVHPLDDHERRGVARGARRVREQRYAFSRDEEEEGLSGIATGIRGTGRRAARRAHAWAAPRSGWTGSGASTPSTTSCALPSASSPCSGADAGAGMDLKVVQPSGV